MLERPFVIPSPLVLQPQGVVHLRARLVFSVRPDAKPGTYWIQPRNDLPPNTVVTVVQKGYTLNGRLVRPALVMVSSAG
jgi:hypothetical protein